MRDDPDQGLALVAARRPLVRIPCPIRAGRCCDRVHGPRQQPLRSFGRRAFPRAAGDLLRERDPDRVARNPAQEGGGARRKATRSATVTRAEIRSEPLVPLGSLPSFAKAFSSRWTCLLVSSRWLFKPVTRSRLVALSIIFGNDGNGTRCGLRRFPSATKDGENDGQGPRPSRRC
ncbi:hypothetical protein BKD09_16360 [Bradyrhizobium japonicum]|uniref:Uncharacterized protein n=1 Tax=Bradyrhizobium japonicum TaxID=375 RepID=A0A1L3F9I2_BRAJP|nr:hypothetical protein BKD09_16360 [Bradyrhizobium japonicum]